MRADPIFPNFLSSHTPLWAGDVSGVSMTTDENGKREAGKVEANIEFIKDSLVRIEGKVDRGNEDYDSLENRVTRVEERQTLWHGVQTTFTIAVGAVAAWLGSRNT